MAQASQQDQPHKEEPESPPYPQIECPPCAMRGSELLVSGVSSAPNPAEKKLRKQKQPRAKSKKAVRSNRASELRKQQHRQEAEYPDGLQAQQQQQPSPHLRRLYKGRGPSAVFLGSNSDSDSDTDSDSGALPDLHLKIIEPYRSSAGLPRTSTQRSVASQSKNSPARNVPHSAEDPSAAAGSGSSSLDLPRLREQLQETERQRSKLKNRLAELAKLMSESMAEEHRPDDAAVAMETAAAKLATVSTDSRYPSDPSVEHDDEDQSESLVSVPEAEDTVENVELPPLEVEKPQTESASVAIQTDQLLGVADKPDLCDRATQSVTSESPQSQQLLEAQSRERQSLLARLKSAAEDCANLRLDREAMRRQLDAAQFDRRMALAEAEEKRADLATARREVDDRDGRLERMAASQVRTEKEVGNLRSQLSELRRQLDSAENSCQAEAAENQRHRAKILSLESQLDSRIQELAAVTNALIEKRRSEEDLLARVQQLQRALTSSEETVARLTGQLAAEQRRVREILLTEKSLLQQQQQQLSRSRRYSSLNSPSQLSPREPTDNAASRPNADAAPRQQRASANKSELVSRLEQRIAEMDARIERLTAEARDRMSRHQQQRHVQPRRSSRNQSQQQQQQQPNSNKDSAGSNARKSQTDGQQRHQMHVLTAADCDEGALSSLEHRAAQLESSNRLLVQDVQSLRCLCSGLLLQWKEGQRNFDGLTANQQPPPQQLALTDYLQETEKLRRLIDQQMREMLLAPQEASLISNSDSSQLFEDLRIQQEAINQRWHVVQLSFNQSKMDTASNSDRCGAAQPARKVANSSAVSSAAAAAAAAAAATATKSLGRNNPPSQPKPVRPATSRRRSKHLQ
ncbi:hypothetical protein BOX15_Mlig006043g2 [Macrostomum lignano]|uniref:Uncharacterized protein n=1 Tax=Macrostomum lignano TaxID=282301 RepID=A0A267EIR0_9PLAT|nr:hypothetical protein BOX15_Mlig006043g2 [Macrostomum lignano]